MERRSLLQSLLAAAALEGGADAAKAQSSKEAVFVAAGEDRFHDAAMLPHCKLSAKDTNGAMCVFGSPRSNGSHRGAAVPLHVHHDQDEFWYVGEGEVLFQVGDRKMRAQTGDAVFGPRRVPHSLRYMSEGGSLISVLQPAGTIRGVLPRTGANSAEDGSNAVSRTDGRAFSGPWNGDRWSSSGALIARQFRTIVPG